MSYNHRKSVTFRLAQAAKAYRHRSTVVLGELNLHPGQDQILKALADEDGQTMGKLATVLAVQPPTITKMVTRMGAYGLIERRANVNDGRSSSVYLTPAGHRILDKLDRGLRRMERHALRGMEEKDRKRLRKALRQLEHNLNEDLIDDFDGIDEDLLDDSTMNAAVNDDGSPTPHRA